MDIFFWKWITNLIYNVFISSILFPNQFQSSKMCSFLYYKNQSNLIIGLLMNSLTADYFDGADNAFCLRENRRIQMYSAQVSSI